MKKHILIIVVGLISLSIPFQSMANDAYVKKGWTAFIENDFNKAREYFIEALDYPETRAEASIMLSLISSFSSSPKEAFSYYLQFQESAKEPDPYSFGLWYSDCVTGGRGKLRPEQVSFLENLTVNPETNPTIRAVAWQALGFHYRAAGDFKKAETYFINVGSVDVWQATGSFENISESGFDKNYGPLDNPKPESVFLNKTGAEIEWFTIKGLQPGRWVDLENPFYAMNSIIYAQTFCESPSSRDVQFRVGTSGSLKVWLNDNLIFSESTERNNGMDTYTINTKLARGNNRILLQIGESEVNANNFLLRITDPEGKVQTDLSFSTEYDSYSKEQVTGTPEPIFAEAYFEDKLKEEPDNLLYLMMMAEVYMRNDKSYKARKIINHALELAPKSSYLRFQLIRVYSQEDNNTALSLELERLKSEDPDFPLSLDLLFDEAMDKEEYDEAEGYLESIENIFGETADVISKRISLAAEREQQEILFEQALRGYSLFPENSDFVELKAAIETEVNGNTRAAIKVYKKFLKKNFTVDANFEMAKLYFSLGDIPGGLDILRELVELYPEDPQYPGILANISHQRGNYGLAENYTQQCLDIAPYKSYYYSVLGDAMLEGGKKDEAIEAYITCLHFAPNDYDTRHKLQELQGNEAIFDNFTEPDYYKLYESAPEASEYPEDNSLIVHREVQRVIYKGGGSEEKHFLVVKVFNSAGIDTWKEYQLFANSQSIMIEKAEVLKKDGNRLKAEISGGQIVFTNLEEGDGILLIYKAKNYQFGKLSEHFWDKFSFSSFYPVAAAKYSLMVPKGAKFQYKVENSDMTPMTRSISGSSEDSSIDDGYDMYIWQKADMPAVRDERLMPSLNDVGEILNISSMENWNFVSEWYSDLSRNKAKSDFEVQEVVAGLLKDKEGISELEQARIFYEYIVRNIRYSSVSFRQSGLIPQKASKVLNTRVGDCKDVSTLFVAMCKEVGIDAQIVLVNTRQFGARDLALPSIDFNHAIAKANLDGKDYYIELTSDYNPFATCGQVLKRAFVLEITDDPALMKEPFLLDPSTRTPNKRIRETKVTFDGDKMIVSKSNTRIGTSAASFRSGYRDIGDTERKKDLTESLSKDHPNLKLQSMEFDANLKTLSDTVTDRYVYTVERSLTNVAGLNLLALPFSDNIDGADFISTDTRKYPIEFWRYSGMDVFHETMVLTPPSGMKLAEIPKNVRLTSPIGTYDLSFKKSGNDLYVTRTLTISEDTIGIDKYEEMKDFMNKVLRADDTQVAFK